MRRLAIVLLVLVASVKAEEGACDSTCANSPELTALKEQLDEINTQLDSSCDDAPTEPPPTDEPSILEFPDFEFQKANTLCLENTLLKENICLECCARKCLRDPRCVGFQYNLKPDFDVREAKTSCELKQEVLCASEMPWDGTVVYLRVTPPAEDDVIPTKFTPVAAPETKEDIEVPPEGYTLEMTDFECPGNQLREEYIPFADCSNKCNNWDTCIGFVYSLGADFAWCRMKTVAMCENPVARPDTVVYKRDNPPDVPELTIDDAIAAGGENFGSETRSTIVPATAE